MLFTNKNKRNTDMVNNLDDSLRCDILTEESYPPKNVVFKFTWDVSQAKSCVEKYIEKCHCLFWDELQETVRLTLNQNKEGSFQTNGAVILTSKSYMGMSMCQDSGTVQQSKQWIVSQDRVEYKNACDQQTYY